MAVITFDRPNKLIVVGHLTNQKTVSVAEALTPSAFSAENGLLVAETGLTYQGDSAIRFFPYGPHAHVRDSAMLVTPDTNYTCSAWVWGTNRWFIEVYWFDSLLNLISENEAASVDLSGQGWTRLQVSSISPPNANYAVCHIHSDDPTLGFAISPGPLDDTTSGLPPNEDDEWLVNPNYIIIDAFQSEEGSVATEWHSPSQTDTEVTIQEIYDKTIVYMDDANYMDGEQILSAEGKAELGGGQLTVVTLKMLNGWKLKFTDRFNEPHTLCKVIDGNFVGDGYFPLESSNYVFSVISQATTGALVPGSEGATATAVWGEPLSSYVTAGTAGLILREAVSDAAKAVWDEALASHLVAGSTGEKLDAIPTAAEVTDAVWNEPQIDHLIPGSTGESLDDAGAAGDPGAVWDELTSAHQTTGTFGYFVQKLLTVAKFLGLKD